jgi:hypothetical protein
VNHHAAGPFDVTLTPEPGDPPAGSAPLGRMTLAKRFHGDLEATGSGVMISVMGEVKGSAAYSAIERVTGSLHGREGSFVLQHTGVMNRGVPSLAITVVPDSGTGALAGLRGTMAIAIDAGKHAYVFDYALGEDA